MWIYNKNELKKFIKSSKWLNLPPLNTGIIELSAFDFISNYKNTLIPLIDNKLDPRCKNYHLPNNYLNKSGGWKLNLFTEVLNI